jgi:hypothetical protein
MGVDLQETKRVSTRPRQPAVGIWRQLAFLSQEFAVGAFEEIGRRGRPRREAWFHPKSLDRYRRPQPRAESME